MKYLYPKTILAVTTAPHYLNIHHIVIEENQSRQTNFSLMNTMDKTVKCKSWYFDAGCRIIKRSNTDNLYENLRRYQHKNINI